MMNPFQLSRLLSLSDGYVFGNPELFVEPSDVCIDSRKAAPKTLFVPLKGERTDGHLHIESALKAGSSAVLVMREWADRHVESLSEWVNSYEALFSRWMIP